MSPLILLFLLFAASKVALPARATPRPTGRARPKDRPPRPTGRARPTRTISTPFRPIARPKGRTIPKKPRPPAVVSPPFRATFPGLPDFPGPEWVPYRPPPPKVQEVAARLIPVLHGGRDPAMIEMIDNVFVGFLATKHGEKNAVIAFRLRAGTATAVKDEDKPTTDTISPPDIDPVPAAPPEPPPEPESVLKPLPTLMQGNRGEHVQILQKRLGFGTTTTFFGPQTAAAVRKFQTNNGLVVDGIVGPKTWTKLFGSQRKAA